MFRGKGIRHGATFNLMMTHFLSVSVADWVKRIYLKLLHISNLTMQQKIDSGAADMSPLIQIYFLLIGIMDTTQGIMIYIIQYIGNATKHTFLHHDLGQ